MAAVTMCDACKNVIKNNESKWLTVSNCDTHGQPVRDILKLDLCPECYTKLCKLLKQEVK